MRLKASVLVFLWLVIVPLAASGYAQSLQVGTIEETITRSFRSAFLVSAAFAAAALGVAFLFRRRLLT